jgi:hypothetical protein
MGEKSGLVILNISGFSHLQWEQIGSSSLNLFTSAMTPIPMQTHAPIFNKARTNGSKAAFIDVPGAKARQIKEFGDATGYGEIGGEYFSLDAGTDISDLLKGLEGDLCQSPHWGYIIDGELTVSFADGNQETTKTNDLFYWPPGHTIRAEKDTNMILFSPQHEHSEVIEHILDKVQG